MKGRVNKGRMNSTPLPSKDDCKQVVFWYIRFGNGLREVFLLVLSGALFQGLAKKPLITST